uniref:Uncharacterized protein n=1 Tax=Ciona savignyi TaxID=51511 RepID=H2ZI46_CIOSA
MNLKDMDIHWRPQTHMCIPCHVNYTYIIRFDNLVQESNEVLGWIQQEQ